MPWSKLALVVVPALLAASLAHAQLRGHGGPVRAIAVSPDGATAVSGSFDSSAIRWSLAAQCRRAGAALPRERGECGRDPEGRPHRHRRRGRTHRDLDAGPAGAVDGSDRPHRADRGARGVAGRRDCSRPRRGTAPSGCGRSRAARRACSKAISRTSTASRSRPTAARWSARATIATLRIWPLDGGAPAVVTLPTPLNARGGRARRRDRRRRRRRHASIFFRRPASRAARSQAGTTPIIALAISPDGTLVAAAGIRGSVAIIERKSARARAHAGRARACRSGRSPSCPTTGRC